MSLLSLLLNEPSAADRALGVIGMTQQAGASDPRASADSGVGTVPTGKGIFFNDSVDVLQPDDPRLRNIGGTVLARPAARSLREVLESLGIPVQGLSGGYRSPSAQSDIYARKPGLAAPPGSSYHQEGLAIDLPGFLQTSAPVVA